jgi:hypothetical protein
MKLVGLNPRDVAMLQQPRGSLAGLGVVVGGGYRTRQTAAHHVADTQKHEIEPGPVGPEVVLMRVSGTDEERRDQYANDRHNINNESRCLESS